MSTVLRRTQTEDHSANDCVTPHVTSTLTRFFRADHPFDEITSFSLSLNPSWELGRVDYPSSPSSQPRVGTIGDMAMSSRHALLTARAGTYQIDDTGSKNGTYVNGRRILDAYLLRHGDVVECGRSFFLYRDLRASSVLPQLADAALLDVAPLHYQIEPLLPYLSSSIGLSLHGETGTGKEVIARAVHALSGRRAGRFVAINCAAIPENLFESEMFGYRKGAFSGATENHGGAMLAAHGGTLFLDEVAELPLPLQAKLLRVLETKEVVPLGSHTAVSADFRLVSASLTDLRTMVAQGRFRRDLFARLGHTITVAPLREHVEELGAIIQVCLASFSAGHSKSLRAMSGVCFTVEAARALVQHRWPFNIRELKQCIDASLMRAMSDRPSDSEVCIIDIRHLPSSVVCGAEESAMAGRVVSSSLERAQGRELPPSDQQILETLQKVEGNRAEAAKLLDVSERTIYRRLSRLRTSASAK